MRRFFGRTAIETVAPTSSHLRAEDRTATNIAATIDWGGEQCPCTVVDVTPSGARLLLDGKDRVRYPCFGQQVVVTPSAGEPIAGVLRWQEGRHLGVRFLTQLSHEFLETMVAASNRPIQHRPTRIRVRRPATVNIGNVAIPVSLINISSGGAMIETKRPIPTGTSLFLTFDDLRPIGAYVRRWSAGEAGLIFSRLLQVDAARHIAQLCSIDPRWIEEVIAHHDATGDKPTS